ncbi:MAG: flagellar basal-body rod protein FlgG [Planctomycetota bacterium]
MAIVALHAGSTGLSALNTQLDVIANNLANVNTAGFKGSRVNFEDLLYQERALPGVENANGDERPTGLYVGLGVKVSGTQLNFTEGSALETGQPLDMMIDGKGFFQVVVESDRGEGGIAYTRAGNFALNSDGEIVLANSNGRRLEPNITVPQNTVGIEVAQDGTVFALPPGDSDPVSVGQIELATFVNPAGLKQIGENLYVETAASGPPSTIEPATGDAGRILGGFLEGSNVDPTRELIDLIRTQRAFEMNSQSIRTADEVLQQVSQLRR